MKTIQAAIYARVSSERQATAQTIASQLAALRERVAADGCALPEAMQFLDDGYSGTTLVRRRWSACATLWRPALSTDSISIRPIV